MRIDVKSCPREIKQASADFSNYSMSVGLDPTFKLSKIEEIYEIKIFYFLFALLVCGRVFMTWVFDLGSCYTWVNWSD